MNVFKKKNKMVDLRKYSIVNFKKGKIENTILVIIFEF